jgi:chromosome segregation ATPase
LDIIIAAKLSLRWRCLSFGVRRNNSVSILDQFQKLDDLIIERTQPPLRTELRNQLALTREQVEAYQESSDKQDKTLAAQLETITSLQDEIARLKAELQRLKSPRKVPKVRIIDHTPPATYEPEQ